MRFVLLFGPQAVGKMTVGEELAAMTGLKLFHNHMTIELVSHFFPYDSPEGRRLVNLFRREIMEAVARSEFPGMIFTFVWALDQKEDWEYVRGITDIFARQGAEIDYVELEADLAVRLERNKSPHRLAEKPTKRNVSWSEAELLDCVRKYRLNSLPGEIPGDHFLRLDNTSLSPREAAERIYRRFWRGEV